MKLRWTLLSVLFLLAQAAVHAWQYSAGFDGVPTIGELFVVNVVAGVVLAGLVAVRPTRWILATAGAYTVASLGALLAARTVGLFGFQTILSHPEWLAIAAEVGALAALAGAFLQSFPFVLARGRRLAR